MKQGKTLHLRLPDYSDALDVMDLVENFKTIEDRAPGWTNFANSGTVWDSGTDFRIEPSFPVGEEHSFFSITTKMPRAYKEGDTITVEGKSYNLYQGTDPALSDVWKLNEVVTLNFDQASRKCWASAGGGAPRPLPPQVSNLNATALEGETPSIVLTWTNPVDDNFSGLIVVMKEGSAPNGIADGQQVYKGDATTVTITEGIEWEHTYYFRAFAYNSQDKYQMDATGAITNVTPSNVPDAVSGLALKENKATATLTWTNPTNASYSVTKVVQKINSAPQNPKDGTEVYSGNGTTVTVDNLQENIEYYFSVFALSKTGKYNSYASTRYVNFFPDEPTSYSKIADYSTSGTFTAPEDGWYRLDAIGASSMGSPVQYYGTGQINSGAGGGSGALASKSLIKLNKGDTLPFVINTGITVQQFGITVSQSSPGVNITGGNGGKAVGGDYTAQGARGEEGEYTTGTNFSKPKKGGVTVNTLGYNIRGGNSGYSKGYQQAQPPEQGFPNRPFVRFLRGNTNVLEAPTAQTFATVQTQQAERAFATEQTVAENKANQDRTNEENAKSMQALQAQQEEAIIDTDYRLLMLEDTQTTM